MKKIMLVVSLAACVLVNQYAFGNMRAAGRHAPEVEYVSPRSQATVDLHGQKTLAFKWKPVPIPAGGRRCYKFTLYKGYGYDVAAKSTLEPDITSFEVPADVFENGKTYSWEVKQRDDRTADWSIASRWAFTVSK